MSEVQLNHLHSGKGGRFLFEKRGNFTHHSFLFTSTWRSSWEDSGNDKFIINVCGSWKEEWMVSRT